MNPAPSQTSEIQEFSFGDFSLDELDQYLIKSSNRINPVYYQNSSNHGCLFYQESLNRPFLNGNGLQVGLFDQHRHRPNNISFQKLAIDNLKASNTESSSTLVQTTTKSQSGQYFLSNQDSRNIPQDTVINKIQNELTSMQNAVEQTVTSGDQQRRNKKRKPPNYYQSAEYAALIKTKPDESQSSSSQAHNNSDSSIANTTATDTSIILEKATTPNESIQQTPDQKNNEIEENSNHQLEATTTTQREDDSQIVEKLKEIKLDEVKESSVGTVTSGSGWGVNKTSWSSLFKSSQPSTTVSSSNKQPVVSSSSKQVVKAASTSTSTSTTTTHLNGGGATHNDSTTPVVVSKQADALLKSLGAIFKDCSLKHSAPALQPRGIRNKNNWCYVNATLQALLACPPLYNLIKSVHTKIKSMSGGPAAAMQHVPVLFTLGRFVSEFKVMIRPANTGETAAKSSNVVTLNGKELVIGDSFDLDYFYDTLSSVVASTSSSQSDTGTNQLFAKSGRQEDAQEFLSFLLNRLHDEMVKCLENGTNTQSSNTTPNGQADQFTHMNGNQNDDTNNQNDDDEWKEVGKKNKAYVTRKAEFKQSPLSDIFCGQFRSALLQSGVKDKESVSLEPFFTLPLEIQADTIKTVTQALEHFVQKEELFGFTHQETKKEIEAFKRISFEDLPPVLILYLKCFVYDKQGGIQKLLKRVEFQIDLEISKELISPTQRSKLKETKRKYKLFAVEYHQGERASGGHYITDVYHPGIVSWVRFNDANVQMVTNSQVLKSEDRKLVPYLLYYRRADLI